MQTVYKLRAQEINEDFLRLLRAAAERSKSGNITVAVDADDSDEAQDETAYLLGSQANKERLLANIADSRRVTFTEAEFEEYASKSLKQ